MCVRETLSLAELCALFHRNPALSRNFALADSQEYLALLLWIVDRNQKEMIKK